MLLRGTHARILIITIIIVILIFYSSLFIYGLLNDAASVGRKDDKWIINWEECGRKGRDLIQPIVDRHLEGLCAVAVWYKKQCHV
jgi:hypothetical protein